jgi:hypothetical protein
MYSAKIVADSIMPAGHRLTSMEVVMPRIILAEFNTHRMLSRNSASSRAIPFKKMVEVVKSNPFIPLKWLQDHSGMQGIVYITNSFGISMRTGQWLEARDKAIEWATVLNERVNYVGGSTNYKAVALTDEEGGAGITKQLCNRLLEPFMWHTVLCSATEYENFFALRAEGAAEIHMQKVAETMLKCMNTSVPRKLLAGEWHIPYGDGILISGIGGLEFNTMEVVKIATAKCAQVSYTVVDQEGKPMDYAKLIALHDRLAASGHFSPFEHCARVMTEEDMQVTGLKNAMNSHIVNGWSGNFRGFIQYRKMFPNENRRDSRLINHKY